MPIYDYKCDTCGTEMELIGRPNEETFPCEACNRKGMLHRQFHSRFGINMGVGAYGYYDENLGTYIRTNAHKKKVMRDQGVSEKYGKGWR